MIDDAIDDLPEPLRSELRSRLDAAKRQALDKCIELTGDAEVCALGLKALEWDAGALNQLGEQLAGKGAAAACAALGAPAAAPLCAEIGEYAFNKAWNWARGRQYRRPLYRFGMVRIIRGGPSALRKGEYLMSRAAISRYNHKIRIGNIRYDSGMAFHRARPIGEEFAVKAELRAVTATTETGVAPEVERVLYIASANHFAVPATMGPTWQRDLDGVLRKTREVPEGLTGFQVSPIKRLDSGQASFSGWVDLSQPT